MRKLGFGIIGTGSVAKIHASVLSQIPEAKLVAISSSTSERGKVASSHYNVPVFLNYHELLALDNIDAVVIAKESSGHLEPTLAAASAGKHVLSEKPLEISVERAKLMIAACQKSKVILSCVFQNRFNPCFQFVKDVVAHGFLGKLLMGNAHINWYRKPAYYSSSPWKGTLNGDGGAALINQGIHSIDLLLELMGEVQWVFGKVDTLVHEIEGEDVANATIQFKSGAQGSISAGTSLYPGYPERIEIYGKKGSVVLEGGSIKDWNVPDCPWKLPIKESALHSGAKNPADIGYQLHKFQLEDFIEAIRLNQEPTITGEKAVAPIQLIEAIYRSSKENRVVSI